MSEIPTPKNPIGNAIKIYIFPAMVTILATLIWRDVTEMRNDVKMLLAQSNIDKTDIQNMKRDIQMIEHEVFKSPMQPITTTDLESNLLSSHDRYFKHEEVFDVSKYLPKIN